MASAFVCLPPVEKMTPARSLVKVLADWSVVLGWTLLTVPSYMQATFADFVDVLVVAVEDMKHVELEVL